MALEIVDALEVIEIEQDQRQRCLCAAPVRQRRADAVFQATAIQCAGQRIGLRARLQLLAAGIQHRIDLQQLSLALTAPEQLAFQPEQAMHDPADDQHQPADHQAQIQLLGGDALALQLDAVQLEAVLAQGRHGAGLQLDADHIVELRMAQLRRDVVGAHPPVGDVEVAHRDFKRHFARVGAELDLVELGRDRVISAAVARVEVAQEQTQAARPALVAQAQPQTLVAAEIQALQTLRIEQDLVAAEGIRGGVAQLAAPAEWRAWQRLAEAVAAGAFIRPHRCHKATVGLDQQVRAQQQRAAEQQADRQQHQQGQHRFHAQQVFHGSPGGRGCAGVSSLAAIASAFGTTLQSAYRVLQRARKPHRLARAAPQTRPSAAHRRAEAVPRRQPRVAHPENRHEAFADDCRTEPAADRKQRRCR